MCARPMGADDHIAASGNVDKSHRYLSETTRACLLPGSGPCKTTLSADIRSVPQMVDVVMRTKASPGIRLLTIDQRLDILDESSSPDDRDGRECVMAPTLCKPHSSTLFCCAHRSAAAGPTADRKAEVRVTVPVRVRRYDRLMADSASSLRTAASTASAEDASRAWARPSCNSRSV
jgi:hypothetical protein